MVTSLGEARLQGEVHGAMNLSVSWHDGTISFHQFMSDEDVRQFCIQNHLTFVKENDDDNSDIES
jgi:hypothetical protein